MPKMDFKYMIINRCKKQPLIELNGILINRVFRKQLNLHSNFCSIYRNYFKLNNYELFAYK